MFRMCAALDIITETAVVDLLFTSLNSLSVTCLPRTVGGVEGLNRDSVSRSLQQAFISLWLQDAALCSCITVCSNMTHGISLPLSHDEVN